MVENEGERVMRKRVMALVWGDFAGADDGLRDVCSGCAAGRYAGV